MQDLMTEETFCLEWNQESNDLSLAVIQIFSKLARREITLGKQRQRYAQTKAMQNQFVNQKWN